MKWKFKLVALSAAFVFAQAASAFVVFQDNFDTETQGLNATPSQWTVTNGTVDIIGRKGLVSFFDLRLGNGLYVDLDGSTNNAGVMTSTALTLEPGVVYTLVFDLSGSVRGDTNTVRAGMDFDGDTVFDLYLDVTLASAAPFAQFSIASFTVASLTNVAHIVFDHSGGDNKGLLLDRVLLTGLTTTTEPPVGAVPVPASVVLLGSGLLGLVFVRRRRA